MKDAFQQARRQCLGFRVAVRPSGHHTMTSQGTARGRFQRAIQGRHLFAAETDALAEMGGAGDASLRDLLREPREKR